MKHRIVVVVIVLAFSLFVYACSGPTEVEIQETIDAQVAREMEQKETETAIAAEQAAIAAEKTAIAETQAAMVESPTSIIPTNTPIVTSSPAPIDGASGLCPFYVYADYGSDLNHYFPEGRMGDWEDIKFDDNYQLDPERPNVIQIIYTPTGSNGWAGIYWWDPPGSDFGNKDGGFDLSCATKLTFLARGEMGGEKAEFKVGGLNGVYSDSLESPVSTGPIVLTGRWVEYSIDLTGQPLNHIIGGFVWVTNDPNGGTIYLDDIRFEE